MIERERHERLAQMNEIMLERARNCARVVDGVGRTGQVEQGRSDASAQAHR